MKLTVAPEYEYSLSLLFLKAIIIIMVIASINAKVKSVIVFAILQLSWGIVGED